MPTAGFEDQFIAALSELDSLISSLKNDLRSETLLLIRGDMNASEKNSNRYSLLLHLIKKHFLKRVESIHPTYHHFLGLNGEFDSNLDVLLYSDECNETLSKQICKLIVPLIESHHDMLLYEVALPFCSSEIASNNDYSAPIIKKRQSQNSMV